MLHRVSPCRAHDTAMLPSDIDDPFDVSDPSEAPDDGEIGYEPGDSPLDDLEWTKAA